MSSAKKKETVQAVLIADTYNENFEPLNDGSPVSVKIIKLHPGFSNLIMMKYFLIFFSYITYMFTGFIAPCKCPNDRLCAGSTQSKYGQ